ncbi:hypothetical protein KAT24_01635 [Candidatus Pacearchaeota archaeon]|nr:hypothetical protein [Candidatus Pacearchaeota archaeon]
MKKKKGQEEIVGFALIIIIVSVILLVFLSFSLRSSRKMEIESYEVEGFIQAFLQHTSNCEDALGFLSVQKLIFSCDRDEICLDGKSACEAMDFTLTEICENSWNVGKDAPIKGYQLKIISDETEIFLLNEGNVTKNYKGAAQDFVKRAKDYEVSFKVYYD